MRNPQALYTVLGWQGGTIHEIAKALGVGTHSLLFAPITDHRICGSYMLGHFAHGTCSMAHIKNVLLPNYHGDVEFWIGYMDAANTVVDCKNQSVEEEV